MRRFILLAVAAAISMNCAAQAPKPELEFHMEVRSVQHGLPQQFRFTVRNMSDHDILLPEPLLGCSDGRSGVVWLSVKFGPGKPHADAPANSCHADAPASHEGILVQAKHWLIVRPYGYMDRTADATKMHFQDQGAGTYQFSAEYVPPTFTADEQRELAKAGIQYPRKKLVSERVVLRKAQ